MNMDVLSRIMVCESAHLPLRVCSCFFVTVPLWPSHFATFIEASQSVPLRVGYSEYSPCKESRLTFGPSRPAEPSLTCVDSINRFKLQLLK